MVTSCGNRSDFEDTAQMVSKDVTGSGCSTLRPPRAVSSSTTAAFRDRRAAMLQQLLGGRDGPAGREDVVDDDDRESGQVDAVGRYLQRGRAVLELVGLAVHRRRQLAALAHRQHTGPEPDRDRRAQQEAAGIDARHEVRAPRRLGERIGDGGQAVRDRPAAASGP